MVAWISAFVLPVLIGSLLHPTVVTRMGPNGFVGFRFGVIMANDETWAAAHRAAWPILRVCLLLALVGSAIVLALQLLDDAEFIGHIAALQACGFLVIGTIAGMIKASNAAQDRLAELEASEAQDASS